MGKKTWITNRDARFFISPLAWLLETGTGASQTHCAALYQSPQKKTSIQIDKLAYCLFFD